MIRSKNTMYRRICLPAILSIALVFTACSGDEGAAAGDPEPVSGAVANLNGASRNHDITLTAITSRNWTITQPAEPWIQAVKISDNSIRVSVGENSGAGAAHRDAKIYVSDTKYIEEITVNQDILRQIKLQDALVSGNTVNLEPAGASNYPIAITGNVLGGGQTPAYAISNKSSGSQWLDARISGANLVLSAGDNSSGSGMKTATFTISATSALGEVVSTEITVKQDVRRYIVIGNDNAEVALLHSQNYQKSIDLSTNMPGLTSTNVSPSKAWLSATIQAGKLVLSAPAFTGTTPRDATVTISATTAAGKPVSAQITVVQDIRRYIELPGSESVLPYTAGPDVAAISTNLGAAELGQPTVTVISGPAGWLTASVSGSTLTLTATGANNSSAAYQATVTLTGTSAYGETVTSNALTVKQEKAPEPPFVRTTNSGYFARYFTGNFPVVISAPHGGSATKNDSGTELVERDKDTNSSQSTDFATATDTRTQELAIKIDERIYALTGRYAHLVYTNIKRTKVDLNRSVQNGVPYENGQPVAYTLLVYNKYHSYLAMARQNVIDQYGKGLLIDIHGHGHTKQRVELGYCITKAQLNYTDAELNASTAALNRAAIKNLVNSNTGTKTFAELIRGTASFGEILYNIGGAGQGLACIPRKLDLYPGTDDYFNGGYITASYGSGSGSLFEGGTLDAIQMEFGGTARQTANLDATADKVARAVVKFLEENYTFSVPISDK